MRRGRTPRALVGMLAMAWILAAGAASLPPVAVAGSASAASAPRSARVSPYVRAARQRAQEASAPAPKVNPLMQHRPRMPTSMRRG